MGTSFKNLLDSISPFSFKMEVGEKLFMCYHIKSYQSLQCMKNSRLRRYFLPTGDCTLGSYRVKSENFSLRFQIRNSNIETRNNFKYQMTKISKLGLLPWMFWSLEHFDFVSLFRISDFVLRIHSNV